MRRSSTNSRKIQLLRKTQPLGPQTLLWPRCIFRELSVALHAVGGELSDWGDRANCSALSCEINQKFLLLMEEFLGNQKKFLSDSLFSAARDHGSHNLPQWR